MLFLLSLLAVILSVLWVVGLHELGHAGAATCFNIKIKTISIGFGRPICRWEDKAGRQWIWALWPLGGYVELLNSRIAPITEAEAPFAFDKKPVWVRCVVLFSGALANIISAWLALVLVFMLGYQQTSPLIASIHPNSVASISGLKEGERLISLGDQSVGSWQDVGMQLIMALGRDHVPVVLQNQSGLIVKRHLDLKQWQYEREKGPLLEALGIKPSVSTNAHHVVAGVDFMSASKQAFGQLLSLAYFFLVVIKQLLTGLLPFGLLIGPLASFSLMIHSFFQGLSAFLYCMAHLSVAVALINLFPIPGLDGGSILYAIIEKIRGKPVSVALEILVHRLIMIAFVVILVQLLMSDLERWLLFLAQY